MNLNIGIDIGAANARMVVKGRGLVLDQSSACAIKNGVGFAVGDEAYALYGREPASAEVVFPVQAGVIAREEALEAWMKYIITQAASMGLARVSRVLIAKSATMQLSQAQRLAAVAMRAGAASSAIMSQDILAALGCGADIKSPRAAFIVSIGASQMSATVISRQRVISSAHLDLGLNSANGIITRMIREKYSLSIGPATAEAVKRSLARAASDQIATTEQCAGFDMAKGFPGVAEIKTQDIMQCLEPILDQAKLLAISALDDCDQRAQADILDDGAIVTGGGGMLEGITDALEKATGVKFASGESPRLDVALGLEKVISSPDDYEIHLEQQQTLFDRRASGR